MFPNQVIHIIHWHPYHFSFPVSKRDPQAGILSNGSCWCQTTSRRNLSRFCSIDQYRQVQFDLSSFSRLISSSRHHEWGVRSYPNMSLSDLRHHLVKWGCIGEVEVTAFDCSGKQHLLKQEPTLQSSSTVNLPSFNFHLKKYLPYAPAFT